MAKMLGKVKNDNSNRTDYDLVDDKKLVKILKRRFRRKEKLAWKKEQ